jgi:general secretion pathway protein I
MNSGAPNEVQKMKFVPVSKVNDFRHSGMTLIEVLIALGIIATALVLVASSWGGALSRIKKTQEAFEISQALERKMVELLNEYRDQSIDSIPEEREGDFGEDYPEFNWKLESKKLKLGNLVDVLMSQQQDGIGQTLMDVVRQLQDQIESNVKEFRVTIVHQTPSGRTREYSATTYLTNSLVRANSQGVGGLPTPPFGVVPGGGR